MKPKTREQNFLAKIAGDANADNTMMPRTAEEYFLNQIAENGGSGSGLPSYSSSDIGKVLTVGEGDRQHLAPEDFIPTQTLNFEDGGALLTEIKVDQETFQRVTRADYAADGGYTYRLFPTTTAEGMFLLSSEDGEINIGYVPRFGGWMVSDSSLTDGTHTIGVSATIGGAPVPKWEAAGLPDYSNASEGATLKIVNGVPTWSAT